jgi:hypothetical protein
MLAVFSLTRTQFFDLKTGKVIGQGLTHELPHPSMCFHPTEPVVTFSRSDGTIFHWHVPSSKPIGPAMRYSSEKAFLVPRPDGSGYIGGPWKCRPLQLAHLKPKAGTVAELKAWVEELTGETLDDNDELVPLTPKE